MHCRLETTARTRLQKKFVVTFWHLVSNNFVFIRKLTHVCSQTFFQQLSINMYMAILFVVRFLE